MHKPFRFGVVSANAPSHEAWVAQARRIEELGYSTLLMPDRPSFGGLAPFTALAVAAQATTTLRIGSYVFCNDYRHPAMLAKEVATLDLLSNGRFELGLGAGVSADGHEQMGIPFDGPATRISRLEESLHIITRLFTEESVSFQGKYYRINGMNGLPKPIQHPHPPIFIGTSGKRMLTIAAQFADSIAITPRMSKQGMSPDPADTTPEAILQKIAWVQEAAGERFAHLELAQSAYYLEITDGPARPQKGGPPLPKRPMSTKQAIAHLEEQRERYGFSYIQVFDAQIENFSPVLAYLNGK